jgi:UDP-N-acetylglucosamine--N-acetylmuramyl-(pentapeptide) pyrophosphoryl-undecaprenol N-acetylglucosamine transferase
MTTPDRADAPSVVFAGGGTGGHLYPAIAVARELRRRLPGARIAFAGTARGLEARVVPREGFALDLLRSAGLKGKSRWARLRGLAILPLSLLDSWRIVSRRRPAVVVGVGGYSSGPVVLAAAFRGVPTMVLEQNALPGLTNRLLARWVRAAAVTYPDTLAFFGGRGFVAGNPVRPEFFATGKASPTPHTFRLLVVGGSQGAHAVNTAVFAAAPAMFRQIAGFSLVHQTGERDLAEARERYGRAGLTVRAEAFLDPMAAEIAAADLVLGRAGATTLAELSAVGRPAVLVPLPAAADDHQRKNAQAIERAGGAVVIDQAELTGPGLAGTVAMLAADRGRLARMSEAMRAFARPGAAAAIVDRLLELAGRPDGAGAPDGRGRAR